MASTRLVSNDGTGRLRFSGSMPDRMAALTIGAWFQSPTVPGGRFSTPLAPFGAGSDQVDLLYVTDNYSGNPPTFYVYCGPSFSEANSGVDANTAWFHYSVSYSASGATCRVIRDVSGTLTVVASWTIPRDSWAAAGVDFFNNIYGGFNETAVADTQIAYARVYAATLDATALLAEAGSTSPLRTVWADWPLQDGSLADASGNGRNLATSGTITLGNGTSSPPATAPSSSNDASGSTTAVAQTGTGALAVTVSLSGAGTSSAQTGAGTIGGEGAFSGSTTAAVQTGAGTATVTSSASGAGANAAQSGAGTLTGPALTGAIVAYPSTISRRRGVLIAYETSTLLGRV